MPQVQRVIRLVLTTALILCAARPSQSQVPLPPSAEVWRDVAQRLGVGAQVTLSLSNGQQFRAVLVRLEDGRVLLQPRTRVPVAVQAVPYEAIVSLQPHEPSPGMNVGKTIAIGAASGAGAFLLFLLLALAQI